MWHPDDALEVLRGPERRDYLRRDKFQHLRPALAKQHVQGEGFSTALGPRDVGGYMGPHVGRLDAISTCHAKRPWGFRVSKPRRRGPQDLDKAPSVERRQLRRGEDVAGVRALAEVATVAQRFQSHGGAIRAPPSAGNGCKRANSGPPPAPLCRRNSGKAGAEKGARRDAPPSHSLPPFARPKLAGELTSWHMGCKSGRDRDPPRDSLLMAPGPPAVAGNEHPVRAPSRMRARESAPDRARPGTAPGTASAEIAVGC